MCPSLACRGRLGAGCALVLAWWLGLAPLASAVTLQRAQAPCCCGAGGLCLLSGCSCGSLRASRADDCGGLRSSRSSNAVTIITLAHLLAAAAGEAAVSPVPSVGLVRLADESVPQLDLGSLDPPPPRRFLAC